MQRAMSSSSPRIGSHFASCDDVLAAVRSATFLCEGSDVPIHAEYTSRKTGNGKKITVRCKLGVRKPGRKRAGERIKGEDEYCPYVTETAGYYAGRNHSLPTHPERTMSCRFRLVACRETASTGPPSSNFVVTEFDAHTAWAHECESRIDADVGESMKTETSPSFVPDSPVIIDSQLVTSTGFSIPLLPLTRQTQGGRTRPKKRPVGNCEHRGDAMWRKWEQRVLLGDAVRVAKRPRLRGTGGEDALQAWGWVANLAVEEPELEQLPPSAATANVGTQIDEGCGVAESTTTLPRATERADAALPPHEAGESRDDAAQPQLQHLVAFLKRPTVIRFEPAPVIWRKLTPLPVTPFTPPPPPPCADAGQDERFISPTSTESPAASTHTVESRHETPETSYSPISLSLYRQLAPIQRAPLVQLDKATTPCLSAPADSVDQGAPSHKQEQDALREQVALEALLGLQQLTFHPQSDTAKSQASPPPPPPAPSVSQPLFSSAPIRSSDAQHGTVNEQQTPPLPPRDRKQRKLSRWERPEVAEDDEAKSESGLPSPAANVEEGASSAPSTESPDAATAPTASPPKPAALAFIPRTSKKSAAMRRAPATPLRSTSLSTGGSSTAFSSSRLGMAQNLTSASKMAIAQASKIKRDADLREELRSKSAAPPPTLSGDDEETEAEARVRKAAEQAEGLKQLLWKVGGEREGGKIDR